MFEGPSPMASGLSAPGLLSRFRPLNQIDPNEDFRSLPQLDDVDDVLQCRDGETNESDELWPG